MTNETEYLLNPQYDARKSFYGKAKVIVRSDRQVLKSYQTEVAEVLNVPHTSCDADRARVFGTYSPTTLRHIKEFLKQHGFRADSKAQILTEYQVKSTQV